MSIIMDARAKQPGDNAKVPAGGLDPGLRALLDHVAAELAEEYIRLMEASVEAGGTDTAADQAC